MGRRRLGPLAYKDIFAIRPAVKCCPAAVVRLKMIKAAVDAAFSAAIGERSSVPFSINSNGSSVDLDFSWTIAISVVITKPAYLRLIPLHDFSPRY